MPPSDPDEFSNKGIARLTAPLPAITSDDLNSQADAQATSETGQTETGETSSGKRLAEGDLPTELVDVWNLLTQLNADSAQDERAMSNLTRDLGMLSRAVRQADSGAVWVLQALEAIRRDAEQLQQIAGGSQSALDLAEGDQPSGSLGVEGSGVVARPASSSVPLRPLAEGSTPAPSSQPSIRPASSSRPQTSASQPDGRYAPPSGPLPPVTPQDTPGSLRMSDLIGLDVMPPDDEEPQDKRE